MLKRCLISLFISGLAMAQIPDKFENLKVMSKDTTKKQMMETMKGMSRALGVRCDFCHEGERGAPLSTYDFASDKPKHKVIARKMMEMTHDLNQNYLKRKTEEVAPMRVTCFTCHHGLPEPTTLVATLSETYEKKGIDETVKKYNSLKDRYYGRSAFDFGERSLLTMALDLQDQGKSDDALKLCESNLNLYPKSDDSYALIAQIHLSSGNKDEAMKAVNKALEINPENEHALNVKGQF